MSRTNENNTSAKPFQWRRISFFLFAFSVSLIVILCLFGNLINYNCKKNFMLPNILCLIIGGALITGFGLLFQKLVKTKFFERYEHLILAIISLFSLAYTLLSAHFYYFMTGWDAGSVIANATQIAQNGSIDILYYSEYPNNLLITLLFSIILKVYIQITGKDFGYYSLVAFQAFIVVASGYLTYYSARKITNSKANALLVWFLFLILGILSPWIVVPYTDVVGLLFLSLAVFLYAYRKLPILLGLTLILGYYIKPTVFILAIAVFICHIPSLLRKPVKESKKTLTKACLVFLGIILGFGIVKLSIRSLNITLDKDKSLDSTHFIMMGLNEQTNGVFDIPDVLFSEAIQTKKERHSANLQVSKERLKQMGITGVSVHTARKLLTSFNDGTFAWAEEGNFIWIVLYTGHGKIESVYRNIYYTDGKLYGIYTCFVQSVWIASLAFLAVGAFSKQKNGDSCSLQVLKLALIGYILFEILFEPRARHLLVCLPIILILSSMGTVYCIERILSITPKKSS